MGFCTKAKDYKYKYLWQYDKLIDRVIKYIARGEKMKEVKFTKLHTYLILIVCFGLIGMCILTGVSLLFGFLGSIKPKKI